MLCVACRASSFLTFTFIPLFLPCCWFFSFSLWSLHPIIRDCSLFFLSNLCRLHLPALLPPYCKLFFCSRASLCISPTLPLFLSHPSLFSLVISLSYVCPSLCVCVPPLFVSNSFSREIRDAYLVLLSSTGAAAVSYTARRRPRCQNAHSPVMCSTYLHCCQGPDSGCTSAPKKNFLCVSCFKNTNCKVFFVTM